jgi:hypothetical protein
MPWSSQWSHSFSISNQYPICILLLLPHSCYMPCPSHPPWPDRSNYTWRRVDSHFEVTKGCAIICWRPVHHIPPLTSLTPNTTACHPVMRATRVTYATH